MAGKRKHQDITSPELIDDIDKKVVARSYPRRRTAVACEVCRVRKTRCDAGKPTCGFCSDIGTECQYRLPADRERAKPASPPASGALERIEARLADLEEKAERAALKDDNLATHQSPCNQLSPNNQAVLSQVDKTSPASCSESPQHPKYFHRSSFGASSRPAPEFSFRQTCGEAAVARPNLLAFACPAFINSGSWDDTEEFYDDEMLASEQLHLQMQTAQLRTFDLSRKTTRYLQQSFVDNFLRWMPICDLQDCSDYINQAYSCNFDPSNPSSGFAMLVFAVGAVAEGRIGAVDEELPGLAYFAEGSTIVDGMSLMTRSLSILQSRVMQASYYQFSIRPLQAWNVISQASRDCMHFLSSSLPTRLDVDGKEILHRIFLACSILLHELEAVVKMHPIGLRHFHDIIPLPLSRKREEDLYYFLAQAALRKLLMETLDMVGHQKGQVIYAPVVTAELQNQSKGWYHHLPPSLKFPIDASPLLDPRKSFLRIQYIGLFIIVGWPSVLQVLELGPTEEIGSELSPVQEQARRCLASCRLMIAAAGEALCRRNLGSQLTLWATYVALVVGIMTYKSVELSFAPETNDHSHLLNGYEVLRNWDHLPVIRRGLRRAKKMMISAEIPLEGSSNHLRST